MKSPGSRASGLFSWRLLQAYIGQRDDNADACDSGGYCVDGEHCAYLSGQSPWLYCERINQQKDDREDFHLREQHYRTAQGH